MYTFESTVYVCWRNKLNKYRNKTNKIEEKLLVE